MSMQDLHINSSDQSLTGVCIVADKSRCPPDYHLIDKTADDGVDADLWKDSIFSVWKVYRYLCICTKPTKDGLDRVVESIGLINEKDRIPQGFTIIEDTVDTKEKATKKKVFVVKMAPRHMVHQAVCDIKIFGKQKKPSQTLLYAGDMGGLSIFFQIGPVSKFSHSSGAFRMPPSLPYPLGGYSNNPAPYPLNPLDSPQKTNGYKGTIEANWFSPGVPKVPNAKQETLPSPQDQTSILSGIPFQIGSQFLAMTDISHVMISKIPFKSLLDLEQEFEYSFHLEKSAIAIIED